MPTCDLSEVDGNVFNIIGLVSRTLKSAGQKEEAKEFVARAVASHSYEDVFLVASEYVEVTYGIA